MGEARGKPPKDRHNIWNLIGLWSTASWSSAAAALSFLSIAIAVIVLATLSGGNASAIVAVIASGLGALASIIAVRSKSK